MFIYESYYPSNWNNHQFYHKSEEHYGRQNNFE